MKDLNLTIPEFIQLVQSTKNLSAKTIIAYESDLRDFCNYVKGDELNEKQIDILNILIICYKFLYYIIPVIM